MVAGDAVWPEVSPDGSFAAYRSAPYDWPNSRLSEVSIRVVRLEDGVVLPFAVRIKEGPSAGRTRWMRGGRALAFVGTDETGATGVFVQDFSPEGDTTATRRRLGRFADGSPPESFGLSPDGSRFAIATWERLSSLMAAEPLPGRATEK